MSSGLPVPDSCCEDTGDTGMLIQVGVGDDSKSEGMCGSDRAAGQNVRGWGVGLCPKFSGVYIIITVKLFYIFPAATVRSGFGLCLVTR